MHLFKIRQVDLAKLNSMTKYPAIPTYHVLGEKGILQERVQVAFQGRVLGSEKIDGTNSRIIACPDGSIIVGSREDLLWEKNDLLGNPAMGIVNAVRELVKYIIPPRNDTIVTYYLEVFGKGVGAGSKNYTQAGNVGYRLFDVAIISDWQRLLELPPEAIARWRDGGGQTYQDVETLRKTAAVIGALPVPDLVDMDAALLPTTLEGTRYFLYTLPSTQCKLDEGALGIPEGLVVRTPDRRLIAKLRREDYARALRQKN